MVLKKNCGLKNFLGECSQQVILHDAACQTLTVSSGVPLGSVMGPMLLMLYINDLPVECNISMFTDDTKVYTTLQIPNDYRLIKIHW